MSTNSYIPEGGLWTAAEREDFERHVEAGLVERIGTEELLRGIRTVAGLIRALKDAQTDLQAIGAPLSGEVGLRFGERERLLAELKK